MTNPKGGHYGYKKTISNSKKSITNPKKSTAKAEYFWQ
jgi:hypothetical protein